MTPDFIREHRPLRLEPIEQARRLYSNDYTARQISDMMGIGEITIRKWCGVRDKTRASVLPLWLRVPIRGFAPVFAWEVLRIKLLGYFLWKWRAYGTRFKSGKRRFLSLDEEMPNSLWGGNQFHDVTSSAALTPLELLMMKEESA